MHTRFPDPFAAADCCKVSDDSLAIRLATLSCNCSGLDCSRAMRLFSSEILESHHAKSVSFCDFAAGTGWRPVARWTRGGSEDREWVLDAKQKELLALAVSAGCSVEDTRVSDPGAPLPSSEESDVRVAVPFIACRKVLGASLIVFPLGILDGDGLGRMNILGRFFSGVLYNACELEQIELSRKRWVRVVDAIPDMILAHDEAGTIIRTNRALSGRVSEHPAHLVGRKASKILQTGKGETDGPCPLCLKSEEAPEEPVELFGERSFLVSTTHLPAKPMESSQTIHVLTNIRQRLEAEAALQRERDFSQRILDNTQSVIAVLDREGNVIYINRRGQETSYSPDINVDTPFRRALQSPHQDAFRESLQAILSGEASRNLELPVLRRDGSVARFAINLSSLRRTPEEPGNIVAVMTDMTEAVVLRAKLAHAEKMAAMGRLVSGMAHEVNNPLAAIIGFTDLLLENPEIPDSSRELLSAVLQEADRTKELVQNLLRFARQTSSERKPVQIECVLRQVLKLRSFDQSTRGVECVARIPESLPPVLGDGNQLQQVFLNILTNASDAIGETGRPGRIEVEAEAAGDLVEIRIGDNGPGIANPDHIFEPFFTTKPIGKGTGLGLSICYGIVRAHNGEIVCHNKPGSQGCTFIVRLPAVCESLSNKVPTPGGDL